MKPCPSCNAEPIERNKYAHSLYCNVGILARHRIGQSDQNPIIEHECSMCKSYFTINPYQSEEDEIQTEFGQLSCPVCWAVEEAKQDIRG